ncbi:MAG: IS1595 family transposase [Proteobacteria bacterium]|nr:IS1595 family transposase [Pseudomonadota bacterium]
MPEPKTLVEAVRYFADAERTHDLAVKLRWPNGVHCPACGVVGEVRYFVATSKNRKTGKETPRRLFECKARKADGKLCKRQFTVKTGSIFEDSALPLDVWFVAIWAVANCKNGISSYELARATGVSQKSAWFMLHRIRVAMDAGGLTTKFGGIVESDESYVGGKAENMHAKKRKERITGSAANDKTPVMGLLQRGDGTVHSRVHARVIRDANKKNIQAMVRANVEPGSTLFTDSLLSYRGLSADYFHAFVNHSVEYVRGHVHSNGIENFWSLLKRSIKGTYVSVDPHHLQAYVGEQVFRFNERKDDDRGRFLSVLGAVSGKRLTWKDLTNHDLSAAY